MLIHDTGNGILAWLVWGLLYKNQKKDGLMYHRHFGFSSKGDIDVSSGRMTHHLTQLDQVPNSDVPKHNS